MNEILYRIYKDIKNGADIAYIDKNEVLPLAIYLEQIHWRTDHISVSDIIERIESNNVNLYGKPLRVRG
jgi:hypothetical protein